MPTSADKRVDRPLRIAVDTKNFALYSGGIAAFFGPLLRAWISQRAGDEFILIGPAFESPALPSVANWQQHLVRWPSALPRAMRHPIYDNVLFPRAVHAMKPDVIFTPYHDVRLPRDIPSVMMVHDTCLHDLPNIYPSRIRRYYLHMLRHNLKVADRILTVSQTSRSALQARYGISDTRTAIVPNAIDPQMTRSPTAKVEALRLRAERAPGLHLFYPGGSEHRKNIRRLALAVSELAAGGARPHIWITGSRNDAWAASIDCLPAETGRCFHFLGHLSVDMLAAQFLACDVVVYPTLCEGFGRVALEAMELGVPLACSDIEVLREVAGDYPVYFDPLYPADIAAAIRTASDVKKAPRHRAEYQPDAVAKTFLVQIDLFLARHRPRP